MEFVTIKTFDNVTALGLVQSYLEDEGIECFVKDRNMGTIYSGVGIDDLRIKLQVNTNDAERAVQLLIEGGFARPEDYDVDKTMLRLSKYYEKVAKFFSRKKD